MTIWLQRIAGMIIFGVVALWSLLWWVDYQLLQALQNVEKTIENIPSIEQVQVEPQPKDIKVAIVDVALPPPPQKESPQVPVNKTQNSLRQEVQQPAPAEKQLVSTSKPNKEPLKATEPTQAENTEPQIAKADNSPAPETAEQVYRQLSENKSLDIQLAWPNESQKRENLSRHLYQCVGAEFALLQGQSLTYLTPQRYRNTSVWLRVAQGQLSQFEQKLRQKTSQSGTPIRLFPESVDLALADHIASALKGQPLQSLTGQYALYRGRLTLTNIWLNNQPIKSPWQIEERSC